MSGIKLCCSVNICCPLNKYLFKVKNTNSRAMSVDTGMMSLLLTVNTKLPEKKRISSHPVYEFFMQPISISCSGVSGMD